MRLSLETSSGNSDVEIARELSNMMCVCVGWGGVSPETSSNHGDVAGVVYDVNSKQVRRSFETSSEH